MRNTSALHWTLLVALLASPAVSSAQSTTDVQEPVASPPSPTITTAPQAVAQKRAQTLRDDSEFRALHNLVISADGAWMAAEERPDRGDGNVRVWSTEGDVTFTIERGQNPRISRDSRWVSVLQKPPLEDSRTAKPTNKRAGQTLVVLDTQDGSRRTFDFVLSYDMTYASTYLLYLQSPETKADEEGPSKDEATKPATKERKVGTLQQVPLNWARIVRFPDRTYTWKNVVEFATHPTNDHFAYVWHDEETGGDTLHIVKWGIRAFYYGEKGEKIEGLCWARERDPLGWAKNRDPITLGFLVSTETTGKDGKRRVNSALYTWQPAQSPVEREIRARKAHPAAEFTRVDTPQYLELKTGLKIENGINRGIGYTDSLGTKYNIRYIPITITNNNTIPIHLQIAFSKEYDYPSPYSDEQFKMIPLPKEWALDGPEITDSMINELPKYIDKPSVSITLEPGEEFVAAIGTRYRPTGRGIVPNLLFVQSDIASFQACDSQIIPDKSTNSQLALGLKLDIYLTGHRDPSACILIPCGQISYPER